tara:strand:+ start:231 stop:494 length:264 start_codon:yes stop_codon:yes gene_type:complete
MTDNNITHVVRIEVDTGEYDLVRVHNGWTTLTPVKYFSSYAEAEREASKWATGVVETIGDALLGNYIRPMNKEERGRAFEKLQANQA